MAPEIPQSVLFMCDTNAVRSPIAAGLARHFYGHRIWVESAGVRPGQPDPFAIAAMNEIGIDLSAHQPQLARDVMDASFDLIVALSPAAYDLAHEMTRATACAVEFWDTPDPSSAEGPREVVLQAYREVRHELLGRIMARFPISDGLAR